MTKQKWISAVFCALLALSVLTACRDKTDPNDPRNNYPVSIGEVTIKELPLKVVSLSPLTTEMMKAIGASGHLTAISDACTNPDGANLPRMGSAMAPQTDEILALAPSLLLTTSQPDTAFSQQLELYHIPVLVFSPAASLEELRSNYETLGMAMGGKLQGLQNGQRAFSILQKGLDGLTQPQNPPKAALVLDGAAVATPDTLAGQLLEQAGAQNAAVGCTGYRMDMAALADAAPDILFCPKGMANTIKTNSLLKETPAVKNNRVFEADTTALEQQGIELLQAVEQMNQAILL